MGDKSKASSELRSYAVRWRVAGLALSLEVGEDISMARLWVGGGKIRSSLRVVQTGSVTTSSLQDVSRAIRNHSRTICRPG